MLTAVAVLVSHNHYLCRPEIAGDVPSPFVSREKLAAAPRIDLAGAGVDDNPGYNGQTMLTRCCRLCEVWRLAAVRDQRLETNRLGKSTPSSTALEQCTFGGWWDEKDR